MTLDFSRSAPPCARAAQHRALDRRRVLLRRAEAPVHRRAGQCRLPRADRLRHSRHDAARRLAPRPVGGYTETILRVIDVDLRRVRQGRAGARQRQRRSAPSTRSRSRGQRAATGERWVMFCFFGGGLGGNPESDGLNHGNNPISTATIPPAGDSGGALSGHVHAMGAAAGLAAGRAASRRARRDLRDRGAGRWRRGRVPARRARQVSAARRRRRRPARAQPLHLRDRRRASRRRRWSRRSPTQDRAAARRCGWKRPAAAAAAIRATRDPATVARDVRLGYVDAATKRACVAT